MASGSGRRDHDRGPRVGRTRTPPMPPEEPIGCPPSFNRRTFLSVSAATASAPRRWAPRRRSRSGRTGPVVISSANGLKTVEKAMELIKAGADPLDAAIEGVAIVEADPNDHTVGYGGIPNEEGVVELDAAVMHGPTHGGGAVASLRNIMHPAAVARLVMKRTDHCLLVGEGALRFARAHGFPEVDLLTDEARKIWLHWKETNGKDERLDRAARRRARPRGPQVLRHPRARHDPLLGARHARQPRVRDDDLGPLLQDPGPGRRLADPRRGPLPRQRGRLGRLDRPRRGQPAEPLEPHDRRGDAPGTRAEGRGARGVPADRRDESQPAPPRRQGPAELRREVLLRGQGRPLTPARASGREPRWPSTTARPPAWSIARRSTTSLRRAEGEGSCHAT